MIAIPLQSAVEVDDFGAGELSIMQRHDDDCFGIVDVRYENVPALVRVLTEMHERAMRKQAIAAEQLLVAEDDHVRSLIAKLKK